jgi:hypothetical protein
VGCGVLFTVNAANKEHVPHIFGNNAANGEEPSGSLLDAKGNFFGATFYGEPTTPPAAWVAESSTNSPPTANIMSCIVLAGRMTDRTPADLWPKIAPATSGVPTPTAEAEAMG